MDKGFLDKVLGQIVSETKINDIEERVYPPNSNDTNSYSLPHPSSSLLFFFFISLKHYPLPTFFYLHCRDVYGLNNEESKYVWEEYKIIIRDNLKNNG